MSRFDHEIYEFSGFRLDVDERSLVRIDGGEKIQLADKVFETLCVLVRNGGRLVQKDELFEQVWADSFVEENNINKCIHAIRRALDEKRGEREFIETVKKHGFRFVAEVRRVPDDRALARNASTPRTTIREFPRLVTTQHGYATAAALAFAEPDPDPTTNDAPEQQTEGPGVEVVPQAVTTTTRFGRKAGVVIVLILLTATAMVVYKFAGPAGPKINNSSPSLAVLPPKPVHADNRDLRIELAVLDSLILKLTELKTLNVRQLNAVRKFVDPEEDPLRAGRALGADYVLVSNYQVSNGRVRLTSHLLNVSTGEVEESLKSESEMQNIFAMQDSISNEIGNAIYARFGNPPSRSISSRGTENEDAINLFYEALYLIDKDSKEDSARAADLLGQAVKLDPNYTQAWALRAQAYCFYSHQGGAEPDDMFTLAQPMLEKALAMDRDNCVALTVRGTINRDYHRNFPQAYDDLRRAIESDPYYNVPHRILSGLYYRDRRFAEAIDEQRKAVEMSPTSVVDRWFLGNYLIAGGRRDEGLTQLARVAEMNPSYAAVYESLWRIHHAEGDHAAAYANFMKAKEVGGKARDSLAKYRAAYGRSGWMGVLRTELELTRQKDTKGKYSSVKYYIALLASLVGEKDIAFEYLDEAFRFRHFGISFLKVEPMMNGLRDDPRFEQLLTRAGLASRS